MAPEDGKDLEELLGRYADELRDNHQPAEAERVHFLLEHWERNFVKIVPRPDGIRQPPPRHVNEPPRRQALGWPIAPASPAGS